MMRRLIAVSALGLLVLTTPQAAQAQLELPEIPGAIITEEPSEAIIPGAPGPGVLARLSPTGPYAAQSSLTTSIDFADANNSPFATGEIGGAGAAGGGE